jgi:hypothetical protein
VLNLVLISMNFRQCSQHNKSTDQPPLWVVDSHLPVVDGWLVWITQPHLPIAARNHETWANCIKQVSSNNSGNRNVKKKPFSKFTKHITITALCTEASTLWASTIHPDPA